MTKEEVIAMAREAGWTIGPATLSGLERFAKLVRNDYSYKHASLWLTRIKGAVEAERAAMMQLFTDPENQPTQHGTVTLEYMNQEIEAERERIFDELKDMHEKTQGSHGYYLHAVMHIRARGNT